MARTVAIGIQDFEKIREQNVFYIDKTDFIREWWENGDEVTLITRPRRFGKTLNMTMLEAFFSLDYKGREDLFQGLSIWQDEKYRELQGTYPVIFLSFARIKEKEYEKCNKKLEEFYYPFLYLLGLNTSLYSSFPSIFSLTLLGFTKINFRSALTLVVSISPAPALLPTPSSFAYALIASSQPWLNLLIANFFFSFLIHIIFIN